MAIRYGAPAIEGWTDIVQHYAATAGKAAARATVQKALGGRRKTRARPPAAPVQVQPVEVKKKGPQWGKIALAGGAVLGVGYLLFGRRRRD